MTMLPGQLDGIFRSPSHSKQGRERLSTAGTILSFLAPMGLSQDRAVKALLGERAKLCAGIWAILHDTHAAEDVFQDVIVKALNHLDEFHHESRLLSWSRTAARNRAIDIVRRRNSKVLILGDEALDRIQNNLIEQPHERIYADLDPRSRSDGKLRDRASFSAERTALLIRSRSCCRSLRGQAVHYQKPTTRSIIQNAAMPPMA